MKKIIAEIVLKMVRISNANHHDIAHFLKVYSYAKTIGELELKLEEDRNVLEVAAVIHDIACPLCRLKYGNTDGNLQELEGKGLAENFLSEFNLSSEFVSRVVWLVTHHHSYNCIKLPEHRILLEADFLVNADESSYSIAQIKAARNSFFQTKTGLMLLDEIYLKSEA